MIAAAVELKIFYLKIGIWYFSHRVPADLRQHYRTGRIAYSLRTKSIRDARVRATHPMLSLTTIINSVIIITLKSLHIQPK